MPTTNSYSDMRVVTLSGARCLIALMLLAVLASQGNAQTRGIDFLQEPACQTLTPSSMGGPAARNPNLLVIRWLGTSNYEFAYRDTVLLLDAFFERVPPARSLGFSRDDIKKVNSILLGHPHGDHMADAPYVAQRTGATIIGSPIATDQSQKMGVPAKQLIPVRGGEVQKFPGFTVEAVLARHSARSQEFARGTDAAFKALQDAAGLPRQDEAKLKVSRVGAGDPRINDEGTIAFLFTFENGNYRIMYTDTAGPTTEMEQKVMQRIGGRTNMAIVGYQGFVFAGPSNDASMPLVRLFKPDVLLPNHHDDSGGNRPDLAMYPFFMAVRDELPETRSISPMYKTPICVDLRMKNIYVGDPWAWAKRPAPRGSQ